MAKSFLKVLVRLKRPTQKQIEMVRRRALLNVKHTKKTKKLDAKSVESMLRIVSGRYSDLHSALESEFRRREHRIDTTYARGLKKTKSALIKVEQDVNHLESMGYDKTTSGIDYDDAVARLRRLGKGNEEAPVIHVPISDTPTPIRAKSAAELHQPKQTATDTKTAFSTPYGHYWVVAGCLALSFLDMLLLSTAIERLLDTDQFNASILAFALALVGSVTAFLWGRSQAMHKAKRSWSFYEPWVWITICLIFAAIRAVVIFMDIKEFPDDTFTIISSEVLMAVLLTVLYLGTGLAIRAESRKIFDPLLFSQWRSIKAAKKIQHRIAKKYARAESMILELEQFHKNYRALKKLYVIRKNSLYDAERTTLSSVVKRVLEDNTHLDPQVVEDILQSVLAGRSHISLETLNGGTGKGAQVTAARPKSPTTNRQTTPQPRKPRLIR